MISCQEMREKENQDLIQIVMHIQYSRRSFSSALTLLPRLYRETLALFFPRIKK
jgi:hypothetical protein